MLRGRQRYAKKIQQNSSDSVSDLVSEQFPQVSDISVRIIYHGNGANSVLMVRTVNFFSSSSASFHMHCIRKECTNGGFDLAPKIKDLIGKHKKTAKGKMECGGGVSSASCRAPISYEIAVLYRKCS